MSRWLADAAKRSPAARALEAGTLQAGSAALDYAELEARVATCAARLRAEGLGAGQRVAVRLPPGVDHVVLLHAIWRTGACVVPLHLRQSADETKAQLGRIAPARLFDSLPDLARFAAPADPAAPADSMHGFAAADPDSPALVMFTSGTSGPPKAAVLHFSNLEANARASALRLGSDASDRWLLCLPLGHVGGLSIIVRAAVDGAAIVLHERFDVEAVDAAIEHERVTRVSLVPTTLKRLLDLRGERPSPPSLRTLLIGGAAAPEALLRRARAAGLPAVASYGLTETASQVVTATLEDPPDGRVGHALPGCRVRVVDEAGRERPNGAEGEIQVSGPTVFAGYRGDPAASARAFDGEWLRTGDVGRIEADGGLRVLDRRSDLVVSGGENVYPAEVEAALLEHPAVAEAAVWRRADDDLGHRVVAWLVPVAGTAPGLDEIGAHCRLRLAAHKVPREIELVSELPRGTMGKLIRSQLE